MSGVIIIIKSNNINKKNHTTTIKCWALLDLYVDLFYKSNEGKEWKEKEIIE